MNQPQDREIKINTDLYEIIFELICNLCEIDMKKELKEVKVTKLKLSLSGQKQIRNFINFHDISEIDEDYISLLDILILTYTLRIKLKFLGNLTYLNPQFEHVNHYNISVNVYKYKLAIITIPQLGSKIKLNYEETETFIMNNYNHIFYSTNEIENEDSLADKISVTKLRSTQSGKGYAVKVENEILTYNTFDIDGIIGPISEYEVSKAILSNFDVKIECDKKSAVERLMTKSFLFFSDFEFLSTSQCTFIFLGSFVNNSLGKINLFLGFKSEDVREKTELENNLWNIVIEMKSHFSDQEIGPICSKHLNVNRKSKKATGNLYPKLTEYFLTVLRTKMLERGIKSFFFIESFGNKKNTQLNSIEDLISCISKVLNLEYLNGLLFDICIETFSVEPYMYIPSIKFFQKLGIAPTHTLMFSKEIRNCNFKCLSKNIDENGSIEKTTFTKGFLHKVNFYSTIEDIITPINNDNFTPTISISVFNNLLNPNASHKRFISKRIDELKEFSEADSFKDAISYRKECRINFYMILDLVKILEKDNANEASMIPVSKINVLVTSVTNEFIDIISSWPIISTVATISIAEVMYFHHYLRGSRNFHYIPKKLHEDLKKYYRDKNFLDEMPLTKMKNHINIDLLTHEEQIRLILNFCDNDLEEEAPDWIKILHFDKYAEALKSIIIYIVDNIAQKRKIHHYDLKTGKINNEKAMGKIKFKKNFEKIFLGGEAVTSKPGTVKNMLSALKYRFNILMDLVNLKSCFKDLNIRYFFPLDKKSNMGCLHEINYSDVQDTIIESKIKEIEEISKELNQIKGGSVYSEEREFAAWIRAYSRIIKIKISDIENQFFLCIKYWRSVKNIEEQATKWFTDNNGDMKGMLLLSKLNINSISFSEKFARVLSRLKYVTNFKKFVSLYKEIHDLEKENFYTPSEYSIFLYLIKRSGLANIKYYTEQVYNNLCSEYNITKAQLEVISLRNMYYVSLAHDFVLNEEQEIQSPNENKNLEISKSELDRVGFHSAIKNPFEISENEEDAKRVKVVEIIVSSPLMEVKRVPSAAELLSIYQTNLANEEEN